MKDWITILTFTYPTQAHLAKAKLESEGIHVFLKDELTAQVNNFYSNAIDGVKLQVNPKDAKKAYEILKESGYIKENIPVRNNFLSAFDKFTGKIPILGKAVLEFRLVVVIAFIILCIAFAIILITKPTVKDLLTSNTWCIENVVFCGEELNANTKGVNIYLSNTCKEKISFGDMGQVYFPGFNSRKIKAFWKLNRKLLFIYDADTLAHILNGKYAITIYHNSLTMQSEKTTIRSYSGNSI